MNQGLDLMWNLFQNGVFLCFDINMKFLEWLLKLHKQLSGAPQAYHFG